MTHFIFFLLFVFPILFIFLFPWHKRATRKPVYPPGPRGLPFIGNLHQFDSLNPHLYLHQLSKKYGALMSLKFGSVKVLVISSARVARQAFSDNDVVFSGRPYSTGQQKLSYNGLDIAFAPHDESWREMRKICAIHLFSIKQVNSFSPIRQDEVSHMIKDISKKADTNEVINLSETLISLSSSIICKAAFGKRYRDDETSSVKQTFDAIVHETQSVMAGFFLADYIPSLGWVDKLNGTISRLDQCCNHLDTFYQELIDEHVRPDRPQSTKGDILDLLIQLKEEQTTSIDISWERIKAMLFNIFIGGTDTSSATTTWALTALVKNPGVMKIVQEEIRNTVGKKGRVDEGDIQKLPYLKAVIKEAMRLYPPAPLLIPREITEKCFIDGYEVRPKTMVFVNYWAIGKDPEYWENPDEFLPERFLNSKIDYKGKDFGFIPFGSGRRICPAMSFGIATVEVALANLLYSFDWKLPDGMTEDDIDTDASLGLTMHKKIALCLVAESYV